MPYTASPQDPPPSASALAALPGTTVLEFGTAWCGHCQRAQPLIASVLQPRADVGHLKVEDGPGKALGRRFGVKLWPTLVVLQDGVETGRVVRPGGAQDLAALLPPA